MCNGTIMNKLISFSFPLMLSSVLQLMFNAVDIIVVGRFSGRQALAAVGSTTALINIFTNLFIGISLGANVLAAGYFAADKKREMSEAVHTAITFALISGIFMAFVGAGASRLALRLMDTPADVIGQSTTYMRIYFMGMPFFMLYNYGAAVLRAVGDTKRPLLFLMAAGAANVALDLLLVNSAGCGRSSDWNGSFTDGFFCIGNLVPSQDRKQLSAAVFRFNYKMEVSETNFSGGDSCGYTEYSY